MFGGHVNKKSMLVSLWYVLLLSSSSIGVMGHGRRNNMNNNNYMNMLVTPVSSTTVTSVPSAVVQGTSTQEASGGNGVSQMVGYVKDSIVRSIDGCKLMWSNHGQCNAIRSKQKLYKQSLKDQWTNEGLLTSKEMNERLKTENGGITFEEYQFLQKGKTDRAKLTQLMFMSWGAPRFLPYAIMFFPEMLPSPFLPPPKVGAETKWESLSRTRSHAVIQTLLNIERDARQVPAMAKLNFFGRKAQQRAMERTHQIGLSTYQLLMSPPTATITKSITTTNKKGVEETTQVQSTHGPTSILRFMDNLLFRSSSSNGDNANAFTTQEMNLCFVPKSIVKGLGTIIDGGKSNPTDAILPNFFGRKKLLAHLQKVKECDEFLVKEQVDISALGTVQLRDACSDRLMGCIGRSDEEMKTMLKEWLDLVVTQPKARLSGGAVAAYNDNLARTALMCYNSLESAQDSRSASYLPSALFRGAIYK
mmetsp:Transcript_2305/g.3230  ORF Transcript_2305/g.3230 Transcript_2305/m.3230 type:complete len:475 (-) Transcript_2305:1125-2549(-)